MKGKKWLLVVSFVIALFLGLALIVPADAFDTGNGGDGGSDVIDNVVDDPVDDPVDDTDNTTDAPQYPATAIIDGNYIEYDEGASYYTFTNDTLAEEPVYVASDGDYDIALFYDTSDIVNETLFIKYDNESYEMIYDDWNYTDSLGAGSTPSEDAADERVLYAIPLDQDDVVDSAADGASTSNTTSNSDASDAQGLSLSSDTWKFQSIAYIVICSVFFSLMFARLSNEDIMGGVRKHIYEFISQNPGEHLASITKEFSMSSSSARHHLYVLEVSDKIVSHKPGKYKHYYVNQNGFSRFTNGQEYKAVISVLKNDTSRNIVKILARGDEINQQALSQVLSIHPSTVNWHAKRLMAADVIRKNRKGKDIIYSLNDEIDIQRMISIIEGTSS